MSPETYWDDIIVVSDGPFLPQTLRVDNDTDDHYVARDIIYSWQESTDNIAGIKGYLFDLVKGGEFSIIEHCSSLDNFDEGSLIAVAEALDAGDPMLMTRTSAALLPAGINVLSEGSKISVSLTNPTASPLGHEIQFHNDAGAAEKDVQNSHVRAKIRPIYPEGGSGSFYIGWQNFPHCYENARAAEVLSMGLTVQSLVSAVGLPITIEVEELASGNSAQTLGITMEVIPSPRTEPLYVDLSTTATAINSAETSGADFLIVEIDRDGAYHLVRPTRNLDGSLSSFDREDFADGIPLDVNRADQIVEVAYRENRMDLEEVTDETFSWDSAFSVKSAAASWVSPPSNILWQKIRTNSNFSSFNRIQIRVDNQLGRQATYRFYAYLIPADAGGLPRIINLQSSTYLDPALISTADGYSLASCTWSDDLDGPVYDAAMDQLWWQSVALDEGPNDVTLLRSPFVATPANMTLTEGQDYYLGVMVQKVKDGLVPSADPLSWNYIKNARPSISWRTIDAPVNTLLPEKIPSVRGMSDGVYPPVSVSEFGACDAPTHPAMYRVLSDADSVIDSTYPKDMASGAEIIVTWEDLDGNTCSKIIAVTDRDALLGKSRYAVFGFRVTDVTAPWASISYDYLSTSDGTVISGIDLADDAGYTRTAIDHEGEDVKLIDSKTAWVDGDWGATWAKRFGSVSGIDVRAGAPTPLPNSYLYFDAPAGPVDEVLRSAEAHLLQGTGASSFESSVSFSLDSDFLESEFYYIVLPSRYEGNISDITYVHDASPQDFLIFGFKYNGDVYLYRPNESGIVEGSLVRTLGTLNSYPWSPNAVRIRVDNFTAGVTRLAVWHGVTLIYEDIAQKQILPESDSGFWVGMGYRNSRKPSYTLRMEVGNFLVRSVQRNAPDTEIEVLHEESFSDVPNSRWFTYQGIEQIRNVGGVGSWLESGCSRTNSELAYTVPHRVACPYNVSSRGNTATVPSESSLNHNGTPDLSRFQMHVNIDDTTTVSEFGTMQRWIGPTLVLGKGIVDEIATDRSIRWDLNYEMAYPDFEGESEVVFGIANWIPEDGPGTPATDYEDYAAYSFIETDYRSNTRARIYALVGGNVVQVGMDEAQYGAVTPQFAMISFASNGKAALNRASLNRNPSSDSSSPTVTSLGNVSIPGRGRMSIIVEPTLGGQAILTGTLSAAPQIISLGQSAVLTWTSSGATSIVSSTGNFATGATAVGGVSSGYATVTPNQVGTHDYSIVFQSSDMQTVEVSADVTVTSPGAATITGTLEARTGSSPSSPLVGTLRAGDSFYLVWTSSNASTITSSTPGSWASGKSAVQDYVLVQNASQGSYTYQMTLSGVAGVAPVTLTKTVSVTAGGLISNEKQYVATTTTKVVSETVSYSNEEPYDIIRSREQTLTTDTCPYMHIGRFGVLNFDSPSFSAVATVEIPGPQKLPPVTATISSAKLVIFRANVGYSSSDNSLDYIYVKRGGVGDYGSYAAQTYIVGGTGTLIQIDLTDLVKDWTNNLAVVDGVRLEFYGTDPSFDDANEVLCPSFTTGGMPLFASPLHPNTNWRPYWQITFTDAGIQSVVNVPFEEAGIQSLPEASIQSAPTHCNIKVLVDGELYVSYSNIPFAFFSTDGLRFFTGLRRKTPADRFNTSATVRAVTLSYINKRSILDDITQLDLAVWEKMDGIIPNNSLFYGRNVDAFQCEDSSSRLITGQTLFAQTFIAEGASLRAFAIRVNAGSYRTVTAYLCECDSYGVPVLTADENGVISPTDSFILSESRTLSYPGMEELFFTFSPAATLTEGEGYGVVLVGADSVYGTLNEEIYSPSPSYVWDAETSAWRALGGSSAFRAFRDIYINRANDIHAEIIGGRVAAVNNAGIQSKYTSIQTVTADLLPPHDPADPSLAPTLAVVGGIAGQGTTINYGRNLTLRIGAKDRDVIGSGLWEYRIVYQDSFDQLIATDYVRWNDDDTDDHVNVEMIYPGQFLTTKRFYAEVRDAVGNVSRTNFIDIEFKNGFFSDTEPPNVARIRIEGDADVEPDPSEATVISTDNVDVTLHVEDAITGCKDFRLNHNYSEDAQGLLIYDPYRPYQKEFEGLLSGNDGLYSLSVQARDYGNNATAEQILQMKRIDYSLGVYTRELPTALAVYRPGGYSTDRLYVGTTRRTSRIGVEGRPVSSVSRTPYTAYELWISNVKQTFKANETVVIRVNGTVVPGSEYTRDDAADLIVFDTPLLAEDAVTADLTEEVAVLYRFDGQKRTTVKVFDAVGGVGSSERAISAMCVYGGLLYIGTESGNIYTHNGVRTSLPIYRTYHSDGVTAIPVSCMKAIRLSVDEREYLYVGTYSHAHVFRYGGSAADAVRMWQRIEDFSSYLVVETNVFDIDVYSDMIVIATGPYGRVFRITKSVSPLGVESYDPVATQLYSSEFSADPLFRMDVTCLENFGSRIYAGVDHRSSVFAYEKVLEEQPLANAWNATFNFNGSFEVSPSPWRFYNDGVAFSKLSDNVIFTEVHDNSGKVSDWWVTMIGKKGSYCVWLDNTDSESIWEASDNTTGWTLEFMFRFESSPASEAAYQAVQVLDGTHQLEFRIYKNKLELASGDETVSKTTSSVSVSTSVWTTYRVSVVGSTVSVYANGSNTAIFETDELLTRTLDGLERSVMFGKTEESSDESRGQWKTLRYYLSGALPPKFVVDRDFVRDQILPFGREVRYLISSREGLIAGVQPRDPSDFNPPDDPNFVYPRAYRRTAATIPEWLYDSAYSSIGSSLTGGAVIFSGLVYSPCEVADDPLTATPIKMRDFYTEDPHVAMTRNGIVYVRRHTQAFDEIYKDTQPPDGSLVLNENTAEGGLRVHLFQALSGSTALKDGVIARYSALNDEVDEANHIDDGDVDTYDVIGTNDIRYLKQDFGGDGDLNKLVSSIKWATSAPKDKTYRIEYQSVDTGEWVLVREMIAVPGGQTETYTCTFSPPLETSAIRVYYSGDRETVDKRVQVTISSRDAVIGTAAYRMGRKSDLSDATGWISMTDGISVVPWDLLPDANNWAEVLDSPEVLTAALVFSGKMLFGTATGKVIVTQDGISYTESAALGESILCFTEHESMAYLGTDSGKMYVSEDGGAWTLIGDTGENSVESLASYGGVLYIGTGSFAKLLSYEGDGEFSLTRRFPSYRVSSLCSDDTHLYIGMEDSGQMFRYDGSSFVHIGDLEGNVVAGIAEFSKNDRIYAVGDKGRIYSHDKAKNGWEVLLDTSHSVITGIHEYVNEGAEIITVQEDGSGSLAAAKYSYIVTWVDAVGNESGPGEAVEYLNISPSGRVRIDWREVEGADHYRVYRGIVSGTSTGGQKLMVTEDPISATHFEDDGTYQISDSIVVPTTYSVNELWFSGNSGFVYYYTGANVIPVIVPTSLMGQIAGVLAFKSNVYIWGADGTVARFSGINVGSGEKTVYAQFKDTAGNISPVVRDDIFYNTLIENAVVEVDPDGLITDQHSSVADPPLPLYGATKTPEEKAVYESEPYYSATLSKWDTITAAVDLPPGTEVKLYVRTADTKEDLETATWNGPYSASNDEDPFYYLPYYGQYTYDGYEYDYETYQYYESADVVTSISHDISLLSGKWIQFKLVLVSATRGSTPSVYSIMIAFTTANSTEFFTAMFDLDAIAQEERVQEAGIQVRRGLLTWQGTIPTGGEVTFGICTKDTESREWSDYQIITPDQVFSVTPGGRFKIGIILVSTNEEEAVVDEFAIMLDTGERSVKINLHAYDSV